MIVVCPSCQSRFDADDALAQAPGLLLCPKCATSSYAPPPPPRAALATLPGLSDAEPVSTSDIAPWSDAEPKADPPGLSAAVDPAGSVGLTPGGSMDSVSLSDLEMVLGPPSRWGSSSRAPSSTLAPIELGETPKPPQAIATGSAGGPSQAAAVLENPDEPHEPAPAAVRRPPHRPPVPSSPLLDHAIVAAPRVRASSAPALEAPPPARPLAAAKSTAGILVPTKVIIPKPRAAVRSPTEPKLAADATPDPAPVDDSGEVGGAAVVVPRAARLPSLSTIHPDLPAPEPMPLQAVDTAVHAEAGERAPSSGQLDLATLAAAHPTARPPPRADEALYGLQGALFGGALPGAPLAPLEPLDLGGDLGPESAPLALLPLMAAKPAAALPRVVISTPKPKEDEPVPKPRRPLPSRPLPRPKADDDPLDWSAEARTLGSDAPIELGETPKAPPRAITMGASPADARAARQTHASGDRSGAPMDLVGPPPSTRTPILLAPVIDLGDSVRPPAPRAPAPAIPRSAPPPPVTSQRRQRAGVWVIALAALLVGAAAIAVNVGNSDPASVKPASDPVKTADPPPPPQVAHTLAATEPPVASTTTPSVRPAPPTIATAAPSVASTGTARASTSAVAPMSTPPATAVAAVTPPAATPAPVAAPPPSPDGAFDRGAAKGVLAAAAARAASCKRPEDPAGGARVTVTFAPSGRVSGALVTGPPYQGTPTGACIAGAFRGLAISAFEGDSVVVTKDVALR